MYNSYNEGTIEVICGPMFASKTETIISRVTKLSYAKKKIKVFKPSLDIRYSKNEIVSHSGMKIESMRVEKSSDIKDILFSNMVKLPDAIIIDEVQFFDEGIIQIIEELASLGVRVIAAGLDQNFKGEPFPIVANLMARAEIVTKLTAVCTVCGKAATKSQRLVSGEPADYNDDIVKIGAKESYEARCRKHHKVGE